MAVNILIITCGVCIFDRFNKMFRCNAITCITFCLTLKYYLYLYIYKILDKNIIHLPFNIHMHTPASTPRVKTFHCLKFS